MGRETRAVLLQFAKRLKASRIAAGYDSAVDLARFLGVETHTYRMWERGDRGPSLRALWEISRAVDKSIDFLITGSEQYKP